MEKNGRKINIGVNLVFGNNINLKGVKKKTVIENKSVLRGILVFRNNLLVEVDSVLGIGIEVIIENVNFFHILIVKEVGNKKNV